MERKKKLMKRAISEEEENRLIKKVKSSELTIIELKWDLFKVLEIERHFDDDGDIKGEKGEVCILDPNKFSLVKYLTPIENGKICLPAFHICLSEFFNYLSTHFGLVDEIRDFLDKHVNIVLDDGKRPIHYICEIVDSEYISSNAKMELIDYILSNPKRWLHPLSYVSSEEKFTPLKRILEWKSIDQISYNEFKRGHPNENFNITYLPKIVKYALTVWDQCKNKLLNTIKNRECKYVYMTLLTMFNLRHSYLSEEIISIIWDYWTPFQCEECHCYNYFCTPCQSVHCECLEIECSSE